MLQRLATLWSEWFPAEAASSVPGWPVRRAELLLVVAAALLSFTNLDCPLQEPEETLYAEIPREMLAEGRLLVPVRHGQDYYDKPPLLYWLVMAAYQIFGVHDWAARLVSAAASFLTILATYTWGKRLAGPRAAFAGALMLCLSPRYAQLARMLTTNSLLTLFVVASLATAHAALTASPKAGRRWWLLSALLCGLGILTKGPVALVLVGVPVCLYCLLDRRAARPTLAQGLLYGALALAVSLPWFIAVAVRDPFFLEYFVWTHHIRRVLDPIDHAQPFGYYLPLLALGMFPWTLLVPGLGLYLVRRLPSTPRPAALGFYLLAGTWSLLFFSLSICKRPCYIIPVLPPLALALGTLVDVLAQSRPGRFAVWRMAAVGTFVILFGAALWALPGYALRFSLRQHIVPQQAEHTAQLPVVCYPHGWDAISFYLQRGDVQVFKRGQESACVTELQRHERSLLFVKTDTVAALTASLPSSLSFEPCSRDSVVTVGYARRTSLRPWRPWYDGPCTD